MSTFPQSASSSCSNCGAELPFAALACPSCHALVYSDRLDQLARDARALELKGSFLKARELWEVAQTLLPPDSKQSGWVRERLQALDNAQAQATANTAQLAAVQEGQVSGASATQSSSSSAKPPKPNWVKRLGPFGPVALLLLKLKSVLFLFLKLKFLFSFAIFIGLYVGLFGWRFGLGISVCILIHELGHFIDIRRRGLPADMPVFLPGLGAYVRWNALGVTRRQIAQISLAGPLAGWIAAACCFLLYVQTHDPLWLALARIGATLNVLNLIPIFLFDGGQAAYTLGVLERTVLGATALGLWYYTHEGLFAFVAAGFAWRIFTGLRANSDAPPNPDTSTWAYFTALLIALALLMQAAPDALIRGVGAVQ